MMTTHLNYHQLHCRRLRSSSPDRGLLSSGHGTTLATRMRLPTACHPQGCSSPVNRPTLPLHDGNGQQPPASTPSCCVSYHTSPYVFKAVQRPTKTIQTSDRWQVLHCLRANMVAARLQQLALSLARGQGLTTASFMYSSSFVLSLTNCIWTGFAFVYMKDKRDGEDAIRALDR